MSVDWVERLFRAIDDQDVHRFASFLTEDAVLRFGNAPAIRGKRAIEEAVAGFFQGIAAVRHQLTETRACGAAVIVHGLVSYTRRDRTQLTVPFANILKLREDGIEEYLIFVDLSEL